MKNNDDNFDILKTISSMSDEAIYKMGLLHEAREKALASARLICLLYTSDAADE